jgi:glycosyltransferase involved in cell wall biosynthesis
LFHVGDEPPTSLTIAWVGRFEPSKDPIAAVAALAELRRLGVDFGAWFAGTGSLEGEVVSLLARERLAAHVELVGSVSPAEIAARLRSTRVLLNTSLWEGQPRAVLEALGCGVCVVAPGVGDVPLLVHHGRTGFIAESTAPKDLSALLARVDELDTPAEIAESVRNHHARVVIGEIFEELGKEPS